MSTTYSLLRSRTFWTIAVAIIIAVLNAITPFISPEYQGVITTILGVLAIYFHNNTAQKANAVN
jgi:membrane protein implicated in regulation of membrane protease activity